MPECYRNASQAAALLPRWGRRSLNQPIWQLGAHPSPRLLGAACARALLFVLLQRIVVVARKLLLPAARFGRRPPSGKAAALPSPRAVMTALRGVRIASLQPSPAALPPSD